MNRKICLAALLAATAAPVCAETGFRADVHVGWDRASVHQRTDVGINGATTRDNESGLIYGGEIGYDLAIKRIVIGVYGGIEGATTRKCSEVFAEVETCAKWGRNFTLGTRLGVQVTDRVQLYAKSGYSNGQARVNFIDHATPAHSFGFSEDMDGYHFGAGVEVGLVSKLHAKLEYVHTNYRDYTDHEGTATITGGIDRDNVMLGFGIRF